MVIIMPTDEDEALTSKEVMGCLGLCALLIAIAIFAFSHGVHP